jgi:hypothetical protein
MRLSLKSLVLAPVLLAAAALTTQPASAAVLHVPFAFTVSGKTLPAGDYSVTRDNRGAFVVLASAEGKQISNWLISPGDDGAQGVAMLFDSTDSGYALQSIRYNSMSTPKLDKLSGPSEDRPVHVIRGE